MMEEFWLPLTVKLGEHKHVDELCEIGPTAPGEDFGRRWDEISGLRAGW